MTRKEIPATEFVKLKKTPEISRHPLQNGVNLLLMPIENTSLVRIDFIFYGGKWVQSKPMTAFATINSLKDGSRHFSPNVINEKIDYYGATFNANAFRSYSLITLTVLNKFIDPITDIVKDFFTYPLFNKELFLILKQQLYASYAMKMDKVKERAKRLLFEKMFGTVHPLGRFENPESLESLSIEDLNDYFTNNVYNGNCDILVSGGFDDDTIDNIAGKFGEEQWGINQCRNKIEYYPDNVEFVRGKSFKSSMERPTIQSALYAGCKLPKLTGNDRSHLILANIILGGYFGSRLMKNIREEKGYTYGINSSLMHTPFNSFIIIKTETTTQLMDKVIQETKNELIRLSEKVVDDMELENVKKYLSGYYNRIYENNFSFPQHYIKNMADSERDHNIKHTLEHIKQASGEDIQNFFSQFLAPNNFVWATCGSDK